MPFEAVIPDVQLRMELVLSPVLATEAIRVNGWCMRDVVELVDTKLGAVEAKERSGAVELRDAKEQIIIAETNVSAMTICSLLRCSRRANAVVIVYEPVRPLVARTWLVVLTERSAMSTMSAMITFGPTSMATTAMIQDTEGVVVFIPSKSVVGPMGTPIVTRIRVVVMIATMIRIALLRTVSVS